jgi:2'-5' RNA ligase superfamily
VPLALEIYLDAEANRRLTDLWYLLEKHGVPSRMLVAGYRPHVSLAVVREVRRPQVLVHELAPTLRGLSFELSTAGTFVGAGVLFLATIDRPALREAHATALRQLEPFVSGLDPLYEPAQWVPHCTLSFGLTRDELDRAVALCERALSPIAAVASSVGIADVGPTHARTIAEASLL